MDRIFQSRIGRVGVGAVIGLGLAAALLHYYTNSYPVMHRYIYGADGLYIPAFYADMAGGGDFSQWVLPPIPSFFPEIFLYFVVGGLTPNLHVAVVVQGMVHFTLFALGLMWVAREMLPGELGQARYGLVALMGLAFVGALDRLEILSQLIFTTAYHFGVLLCLPFALVLTWKLIAEKRPRAALWIALCLLSFLVTASDGLYLIQVGGPLAAAVGVLFLFKRLTFKRFAAVGSALLLSSVAGLSTVYLRTLVNREIGDYVFRPPGARASYHPLVDAFLTSASWWPVHRALVIGFCLLCAGILIWALVRPSDGTPSQGQNGAGVSSAQILLAAFFLLLFASNVVGILAAGIFLNRSGFRYFLPMLILTGFWGFPFVMPLPRTIGPDLAKWVQGGVLGALLAAIIVTGARVDPQKVAALFTEPYYPELVQCLDEQLADYGVAQGIANFLAARPISMLSQTGLNVAQVNRDLTPYVWINTVATFAMQPEFAIIDTALPAGDGYALDETRLITEFGEPAGTVWCGDNKVLVYPNGELGGLFASFFETK